MARKPANHFEVVPIEQAVPRIEPPSHLSADEKALFQSIVAASSPLHFVRSDAEMLAAYVQACFLTSLAYTSAMDSPKLVADWEKCARFPATC